MTTRVLVLGPAPGTAGGIGTMMGHLRATISERSVLMFRDAGSTGERRLWSFVQAVAWVIARRNTYDVAHINLSSNGSCYRKIILSWGVRLARRPYLVHLHGSEFREFYARSSPIIQKLTQGMMKNASRVLVLGRTWRSFVTEEIGCSSDVAVILPNAVPGPPELPDRTTISGNILFTGRIGKRKGIPELLEAVRDLPEAANWSLALAGDVTDDEVQSMLERAPARVTPLGWLSQAELRDVLGSSSIFVLPSHAEGLPLSLLDAMAWGLAPIVTEAGSIGDVVVDREDSLLIKAGSISSIRAALIELIANPALAARLGSAARLKWESTYSIGPYRERLDDVYESCSKG